MLAWHFLGLACARLSMLRNLHNGTSPIRSWNIGYRSGFALPSTHETTHPGTAYQGAHKTSLMTSSKAKITFPKRNSNYYILLTHAALQLHHFPTSWKLTWGPLDESVFLLPPAKSPTYLRDLIQNDWCMKLNFRAFCLILLKTFHN